MHMFDIICGGLACFFIIAGIFRGFVEEVIRLVAVVAAFFTGLALYRPVAGYLKFIHVSGAVLSVIAFLAVFLVCVLAIILLGILIKKIVHLTVLGGVDRVCGGIVGFIKVFFLVWVVVITISSLPFDKVKKWFQPSKSYSFFITISPRLRAEGLIPRSGPVQNILNANPIPAITGALKNVTTKADSALSKPLTAPSGKPAGTVRHPSSAGKQ